MGQWYLPMYETIWESRRTGSPAPPGRRSHQRWPRGEGSGPENRLLSNIRQPLAGRGPDRRHGCAPGETDPRQTAAFDRPTTNAAAESAPQGSHSPRVLHGSVDPAPGGRDHRPDLRGSLPPRPRLEDSARRGLELSETGAPGPGAGRGYNKAVAGRAVAPYKKTQEDPVDASYFLMRAASCSSRWSAAPGRPAGRPPFSASGIAATGSPRSAPSPWLPVGVVSVFTGLSTPTTSDPRKSFGSLKRCADTSLAVSRSSGTVTDHTGQRVSRHGCPPARKSCRVAAALCPRPQPRGMRLEPHQVRELGELRSRLSPHTGARCCYLSFGNAKPAGSLRRVLSRRRPGVMNRTITYARVNNNSKAPSRRLI